MNHTNQYIAFLRGINVGGHKKVPMADLRKQVEALGFTQVVTILNSGNVIFSTAESKEDTLEKMIAEDLKQSFGFPVPVLVRSAAVITHLLEANPFQNIEVTKNIRQYVSFLKEEPSNDLTLPWTTEDDSYRIFDIRDRTVCSLLDLSVTQTTKGMGALEQLFGKNITTRNWNTLLRIANKLG
ncbi:DUF1697 domain-containing protein [Tunicatimonas pelagia]|uniref:DUF1697 domain-containing protein n=1 Tax=Tunicatimonas pelagia TaxID=931531 RepID=UPI002665529B|nr:DUF1697 domain-containing protein [Tunicatimonas pelagia]WKN41713.1 DUF1697 domain-containing protein [Tunicatimonas pelagia]